MEKRPVAYQLYSAREEAEQDLNAVLAVLSGLGYEGVEFAGFYGHSAGEITRLLAAHRLAAVSSHVPLAAIEEDMFSVLSFHRAIGCRYIAIPYLDEATRPGAAGFAKALRLIDRFGRLCREAGIQLLYHNHDFEFIQLSGQYALDFLYDAIDPAVLQTEIDVCWVRYAGEDPAAYLRKYAGRAPVVHLKDYVGARGDSPPYALIGQGRRAAREDVPFQFRPLGHGCQDMASILGAALEAGAGWFVVEQDDSPGRPPLEAAAMSMDTLRRLGVR